MTTTAKRSITMMTIKAPTVFSLASKVILIAFHPDLFLLDSTGISVFS